MLLNAITWSFLYIFISEIANNFFLKFLKFFFFFCLLYTWQAFIVIYTTFVFILYLFNYLIIILFLFIIIIFILYYFIYNLFQLGNILTLKEFELSTCLNTSLITNMLLTTMLL